MPRRTRRRQSGPKKQRQARSSTWINSRAAKWTGIGAVVTAALAALVVFAVSTSSGGDFEFSMYAGGDVIGGTERVSFSELFPAEKSRVPGSGVRRGGGLE